MPADELLRVGQAASLLGVSVDTVRRWGEQGRLRVVRSAGGQRLVPAAEVRRMLSGRGTTHRRLAGTSARNQLDAVVTAVVKDLAAATVEMRAGPFRLVALMTAESVDDLCLQPGTPVVASVKATNVVIGLPDG